jgi:hypothetical protein
MSLCCFFSRLGLKILHINFWSVLDIILCDCFCLFFTQLLKLLMHHTKFSIEESGFAIFCSKPFLALVMVAAN